jgi:hypothetical protein
VAKILGQNNMAREEYQKIYAMNAGLNKRLLFFQEKIKLYQESLSVNGNQGVVQEQQDPEPR